jgi:hypothetical protein
MYHGMMNQRPPLSAKRRPSTAGGVSPTSPQLEHTPTAPSAPTTPNPPDGGFSFRTRRFLSSSKEGDAIKARKKAEKKAEKEKNATHAAIEGELFGLLPTLTNDRKKKLKDQQQMLPQYFPIAAAKPGLLVARPKTAA